MIVPGRDVAGYVPAALASLQAQTEQRWRAVLIDDGSADDTRAVFERAAAEDSRFTVLHHREARGLGGARNAGLELVDTPFLGFLDADDELTPDAIARWTRALEESGSDFVAGAYVRTRLVDGRYRPGRVQPWVERATSPRALGTTLVQRPHASANIVAWSKLSRTGFWDDLRFPEGVAYEDQIVAQLMYTRAATFDLIPDVVVRWRVRPDGTSITQGRGTLPVLRDYLAALRGGIRVLEAAGCADAVVARLDLILAMDLPPLQRIADTHPDPAYRAALAAFVDELHALPEFSATAPDPSLAAALEW